MITDRDVISRYLRDESGLTGESPGVVRPKDAREVSDFIKESAALGRKILPCGSRTATTGAAVPQGDVVLSTEKMVGIVDLDPKRMLVEVLPGTITAAVKEAARDYGLYYPPDPTSEHESTIGGNVATNASGARTFRWGMTGHWVEGLEVVLGNGEIRRFARRNVDKNTAGYGPFLQSLEFFLGSEGTLGVVTRVWLRLIPDPGPFAAFLVFFPSLEHALKLAVAARQRRLVSSPRCVELFDSTALSLLSLHRKPPPIPVRAEAALYMEFDLLDGTLEQCIEKNVLPLSDHGALVDDTVVASSPSDVAWIRDLRHHVPETGNRIAAECHSNGGLKVSTEFCVPPDRLLEIMRFVEESARQEGVDLLLRYGHVGNAHPHVLMRGRDRAEVARLKRMTHLWCRKVVEMHGTVSGEHGIGKTRRDYLAYMHPPEMLKAMRELKRALDPAGILAMGNIFAETPPLVPEFMSGA